MPALAGRPRAPYHPHRGYDNRVLEGLSMRRCAALLAVALTAAPLLAQEARPLTPADAAKKIGQKCTVEMEVQSAGQSRDGKVVFLNSAKDFRADDNFTIMIGMRAVSHLKENKVEDPAAHFKGKTVRVSGTVSEFRKKPQIIVNDPKQIEIVGKDKK